MDTEDANSAPEVEQETEPTEAPDLASELAKTKEDAEKWKTLARKHEDRAKKNSAAEAELEKLRKDSMSEQEKVVATAREEARIEALREVAGELVDSHIESLATGRLSEGQLSALMEGLDRTRFITDGKADKAAIKAWVDRVAPEQTKTTAKPPAHGQGTRATDTKPSVAAGRALYEAKKSKT